MIVLRTGIDMVEIARIRQLETAVRQRFLLRVFTEQERLDCSDSNESLAGRFAAKEAAAKALGTGIGRVGWQDIEVLRGSAKEPRLALHGHAAEMARTLGLMEWSLSISHTREYAVAVVIGAGEMPV